jgi:hypothetical protein
LLLALLPGGLVFVSKITAVLAFVIVILSPVISRAQLLPGGNVYGGAAYADSVDVVNRYTFKGWNASFEDLPLHRYRFFGVVIDGSGIYRKGINQYNLVLGPRLSHDYGKWHIFVDAMGGIQQTKSSDQTFHPIIIDGGAGVDRKLPFKRFAWRFQFDYIHSHLLSANQNDFRGSTGLVWRF